MGEKPLVFWPECSCRGGHGEGGHPIGYFELISFSAEKLVGGSMLGNMPSCIVQVVKVLGSRGFGPAIASVP